MVSVVIKKSDKPEKKLMAVFTKDNGRKKTTHFGAKNMDDYTLKKDKEQRKRYRSRHKKDLSTGDYSRYIFFSFLFSSFNSSYSASNSSYSAWDTSL